MIKKWLPWLLALAYFICPYDVLPDFLVGPGWLDDLAVLALVYWWVQRTRKKTQHASGPSGAWAGSGPRATEDTQTSHEDPYTVLGLRPGASQQEIKTAYKKLAALYHPDKVQYLGKEFQDLAHKKFVAIQRAYKALAGK